MVEVDDAKKLVNKYVAQSSSLVIAGIPAYNEEKTIARVVLEAQKHAHVVVVCDDGSSDLTGDIAERLGAVVVRHDRNLGYGTALQSLFRRARELKAGVLVTFDSDGQHDPAQIPLLVKPIKDGAAEVVLGSRFKDKNGTAEMPIYRQLGIKVITKLANGSGINGISDAQSGFRAYGKVALERLSVSENGMGASVEILHEINKNGLRVCEVPISCKYSNSPRKKAGRNPVAHGASIIVNIIKLIVEDKPLQFLGIPGIASLAVGVFFGIWMMDMYAKNGSIVTNVALASIGFILIGFFMLSTAITLYAIKRLTSKIHT